VKFLALVNNGGSTMLPPKALVAIRPPRHASATKAAVPAAETKENFRHQVPEVLL